MSPTWFKGNNANDETQEEDDQETAVESGSRPRSSQREPDERTRLLPQRRQPDHDGYLDPDDPAVSPYNLWTVRFFRYLTVLFLAITFLWWVLLLVSIFVSPPGMHSRGSGFFDFSYTTLTAGNLIVLLLFFAAPSRAMRISAGILTLLLLVDMILIVSVPRLRREEGWVGIASVVWATVISIWCIVTDRTVAWGKRAEEIRLTGRGETRRTVREWFAVLAATIILVIYIIIAALLTATLGLRAHDAGLSFSGERISVDGMKYDVHLSCLGNNTEFLGRRVPTVLLEGGEHPVSHTFEPWLYGVWNNGTISRYCYWDRPGYAWSDNAPSPHSAGMSADALSEALVKSGEKGPWILVSAGYGSTVSRVFSSRHMGDVAGMMMIDPLHEDLLHRIADPGRGFKLWGRGVVSPLGIQRLGGALFKGRSSVDRVYGKSAFQNGKLIKARLQENLVAESFTKNEVVTANVVQNKDIPTVIISSGDVCNNDEEWKDKQKKLGDDTKNLIAWDIVRKAPHEVWQTSAGRGVMEKRLDDLMRKWEKHPVKGDN